MFLFTSFLLAHFRVICLSDADCSNNNGGCSVNANCTVDNGTTVCTCNQGFTGNGILCFDIDECLTSDGGCDSNALCSNTLGEM